MAFVSKMCRMRLLLAVLWWAGMVYATSAAVATIPTNYRDVYVSIANGTNTEECWTGGANQPCKTILYALQVINNSAWKNDVAFHVEAGNYTLNSSNIEMQNASNVSILGSSLYDVMINCEPGGGLVFIASSNITLSNFTLTGCGKLHHATFGTSSANDSYDNSINNTMYRSGLQFRHCSNITLSRVVVSNSNGIGLDISNTDGDNYIESSFFIHNMVTEDELPLYPGGGGVTIRLQQNEFGIPIQNTKYTIRDCLFLSNKATSGLYKYKHRTINITTGRYTDFIQGNGGGLGIFLQSSANNNHFIINNCRSTLNMAHFGAGLMIKFADLAHNNSLIVNSSNIVDNFGFGEDLSPPGNEGGGVRVDFIQNVAKDNGNTALFYNSTFSKNRAHKGGGLSVAFSEVESSSDQHTLQLVNCQFLANEAKAGSALFTSSFTDSKSGFLQKVMIENSTFSDNHITDWNSVSGYGCVYADKVPVVFNGSNTFNSNSGTALFVSETDVELHSSSSLYFNSNTGHSGGAIALMNKGTMTINQNSSMTFVNNSAVIYGGAIFAFQSGFQETVYSELCFIRYKNRFVHPSQWNCSFTFENNTVAKRINAIATPSLLSCVWPMTSNSSLDEDINAALCWNNWHYIGGNCTEQIETFAAKSNVTLSDNVIPLSVYPGRQERIPLKFYDDKNQQTSYVLTAQINGNQTFVNRYVSNGNITIYGKPYDNVKLILNTVAPRVIKVTVNVAFKPCPPGFELQHLKDLDTYKCTCSGNYKQLVYCSEEEFSASIRLGYFMTYNNKTQKTMVAPWLTFYTFRFEEKLPGYIQLNESKESLNNETCRHLHRTGYMCEECLADASVPLYGYSYECVHCTDVDVYVNWLYYIILELFPVTLFFIVIIAFNVSLTSGPMNGFILFAQIISNPVTVTRSANQLETILGDNYTYIIYIGKALLILPYSIWNLEFASVLLPPFCVTRNAHFKPIHSYALNYFTAFYPLFLIGVTYVCIKLYDRNVRVVKFIWKPFGWCFSKIRRQKEFQVSFVDAFSGFLLLSYCKLCLVSFYLLVPVYGIDSQGELDHNDARLFFDKSVGYFGDEHRPFFFISLFVIVFVILLPPLFLFIYPMKFFQQLLNKANISGTTVRMFVESFQGCYNDGMYFGKKDCRWFASLYFVTRILAYSSIVMSYELMVQRLAEMIVLVILIVLFCIYRPYKDDSITKVDVCIFGCLLIAVTVGMYNAAVPRSSVIVNIVLLVSILLPLLYMMRYTGKHAFTFLRSCCKSVPVEYQPRLDPSVLIQSEKFSHLDLLSSSSSFPDRIINPKEYFVSGSHSTFTQSEVRIGSYGSTN